MNKSGLPPFVRRYNTRFYFRFVIERPRLTEAACFGTTENQFTQTASGQVENINREIEAGRPLRFPNATKFFSAEEASLECDRWRFWLERDYGVKIDRWSCGNKENLICDLKSKLDAEASLEFQDFINSNRGALETHRASQDNSEKQLNWEAQHGETSQRQRALAILAKQAELLAFCQRNDVATLRKKAETLKHYTGLSKSPLESLFNATNGIEGQALRGLISRALSDALTIQTECETIVAHYEKLSNELNKLKTK